MSEVTRDSMLKLAMQSAGQRLKRMPGFNNAILEAANKGETQVDLYGLALNEHEIHDLERRGFTITTKRAEYNSTDTIIKWG